MKTTHPASITPLSVDTIIHSGQTVHGLSVCGAAGPLTDHWEEVTCDDCWSLREEDICEAQEHTR